MSAEQTPGPPERERPRARLTTVFPRAGRRTFLLSVSAVGVPIAGAAVLAWPVAAAAWESLAPPTAQVLRAVGVIVCLMAASAGLARLRGERDGPVWLGRLILGAWAVAVGVVAALVVGAWWVLGTPTWDPPATLTPKALDSIATRAFAIVAGLGGVALLVINYRRQRTTEAEDARAELAVVREDTRLFTERFTTASAQLGDPEPAVKLAGVHALAHLADDAPQGRDELVQMVVDVLCAYLRMPYAPAPGPLPADADPDQVREHRAAELEFAALREVRYTIVRVIGDHLRADTRWRGRNYDFTGVRFDGGDFHGARFTGGQISFVRAVFAGRVSFDGAEFAGDRVSFAGAEFVGDEVTFTSAGFAGNRVSFNGAVFSGALVSFDNLRFTGNRMSFDGAVFAGDRASFDGAVFAGDQVSFNGTGFRGAVVSFTGTEFVGTWVSFGSAAFDGGRAAFEGAVFTGDWVSFGGVRFAGEGVSFERAGFGGDRVSFTDADFTSEGVSFAGAAFTGAEVAFTDGVRAAKGPCPRGLGEALARGGPGGVALPDGWRADTAGWDTTT
ncbi:pentapeptide repeat-containing protein [Marinactinospora thermotolerans]|uniref:pentapeptide repeat-containing protein n=1 Tax=Marinactinospora thermotolerans TaxID=531310 RepID=UPI003D947A22